MNFAAALGFYLSISVLILGYGAIVRSAKKRSSRLNLNHPELEEIVTVATLEGFSGHNVTASKGREWLAFGFQYGALLGLLTLVAWIWWVLQVQIIAALTSLSAEIIAEIDRLNLSSPPFPALILVGLPPLWIVLKRFIKDSITYPFFAMHFMLIAACSLADLLKINGQLDTISYAQSALQWIVFLIIFSQGVWAVSYPNPAMAIPGICIGIIISLSAACMAFVLIKILVMAGSPTITAFFTYILFGYFVFGSHLWTLSRISRAVT